MQIRRRISDNCRPTSSVDDFVASLNDDSGNAQAERLRCVVNVVGEVSEANGLGDLWKETQGGLNERLENIQRCQEEENPITARLYVI